MARALLLLLVDVEHAFLAVEGVHDGLGHVSHDHGEAADARRAHGMHYPLDHGFARAVETDLVAGIVVHPGTFPGAKYYGG